MTVNVAMNLESDRRAAVRAAGIAHGQRLLESIDELRRAAQRVQAAAFGIVAAGAVDDLSRYRAAVLGLDRATAVAEALAGGDPSLRDHLGALRAHVSAAIDSLGTFDAVHGTGTEPPPDVSRARGLQQRADALGAVLDALGTAVGRGLAATAAERDASLRVAEWTGFVGNLAGIASIVVLFLTSRRVERRRRVERARFDDEFDALRSPLEQVRDGLQRLRAQGRDPRALQQTGAWLDTRISKLVERVDEVVDIGRLEQGSLSLARERVDIAFIVRDALASLAAPLAERSHRPATHLPAAPIVVFADRRRLTQVFAKLIENASRHSTAGRPIDVSAEQVGERVIVRVRDEGVGMSAAQIDAIFGQRRARDRSQATSGLRLARALIGMHGGVLEARSAGLGRGSEFVVRLPVFEEAGSGPVAPAAPLARAITGVVRRVLVVDPREASAASMLLLLRVSGQDARCVPDLASAVQALVHFDPDAVVIDADATGPSLRARVGALRRAWRRRRARRPLRIVVLSTAPVRGGWLPTPLAAAISRIAGRSVDAWLCKPVGQPELLAAIG